MGLASCAIGVSDDISNYIVLLLPPILNCFDDEESRIRFYACESLYNIVKAARKEILIFINEIFSTLCELYADVDVEVKEISFFLNNVLYFWYDPIFLDKDKIMKLLLNNDLREIKTDSLFLDKATFYKVGDRNA